MWDDMPDDVRGLIFAWRTYLCVRAIRASIRVQTHWRKYRVRMLLKRFLALRYMHTFREWNPTATAFLMRTRL